MSICECLGDYPHPDYTIIQAGIMCDGRAHMFVKGGSLIKVALNKVCQICGLYERGRLISSLDAPDVLYISLQSGYFNVETVPNLAIVPINADFRTTYTQSAGRMEFIVVRNYGIMIQFSADILIYFDRLIVKSHGAPFILVDDGRTVVGAFYNAESEHDGMPILSERPTFINEFGGIEPFHELVRGPDGVFRNAQLAVNSAFEATFL